ncbi:hypothetical protein ElyMa_003963400 [Elysia marginata]|uniref:Uncharacterized protein n=1 Tax=Elysia marginata TaxID=1093978 RepID=A0AAV4FUR3_9GAST|nr:hypothetical protein ElyMa_003963400 [Elysia marginata]
MFDGVGSDMFSWFSQSRILISHWTTLASDNDLEPLALWGFCNTLSCRRFLIHQTFGSCRYEYFYTFTVDRDYDSCNKGTLNWEIQDLSSYPVFFYGPGSGPGALGIDRGKPGAFVRAVVIMHVVYNGLVVDTPVRFWEARATSSSPVFLRINRGSYDLAQQADAMFIWVKFGSS